MYPYFIALVIYLLIKVYISSTYILTISWSCTNFFSFFKHMQEFFFLVQFLAWIFFLDLTPPLPGYLMVHPLLLSCFRIISNIFTAFPSNTARKGLFIFKWRWLLEITALHSQVIPPEKAYLYLNGGDYWKLHTPSTGVRFGWRELTCK